jgi:hypothetical protein
MFLLESEIFSGLCLTEQARKPIHMLGISMHAACLHIPFKVYKKKNGGRGGRRPVLRQGLSM